MTVAPGGISTLLALVMLHTHVDVEQQHLLPMNFVGFALRFFFSGSLG